jgi:peptide/nickel transport system permease protein
VTTFAATLRPRVRLPRLLRFWTARVGLLLLAFVLLAVIFGPLVASYSPTAVEGTPLTGPTKAHPLGTDGVGRDVLSRVLHGGGTVVGLSLAATVISYLIGLPIGLIAGYSRSWWDSALMRLMDLLLAFPPLLFLLVVGSGAHGDVVVLVIAVGIVLAPGLARIVRAAVLDVSERGYVEAAVAQGEPGRSILSYEILPNISGVLLADAGLRFGAAALVMVGVNFLGFGVQPPSSDWSLMIADNREYLSLQPWAVVSPALAIALLLIATNLVADAVARSLGTSIETVRAQEENL